MTYMYTRPFYPQKTGGSSRRSREQYLARSFRRNYQVITFMIRTFEYVLQCIWLYFQPPNRIIALGYQEPNVFEILEADIPTEPTDNVIVFETEPQPPSKFRKIAKIIYKYGAFVFWLGILFVMVLALGSAAKSHKHRFRYDCDCSNETYLPSCKNCLNGTMSWFEVPFQ